MRITPSILPRQQKNALAWARVTLITSYNTKDLWSKSYWPQKEAELLKLEASLCQIFGGAVGDYLHTVVEALEY